MARDPVCRMEVDEKKAKFKLVRKGKEYYFCSKNCYDKFLSQRKVTISKKPLKDESIKSTKIEDFRDAENPKDFPANLIIKKESDGQTKKIILPIKGMHCASCAMTIVKSLKRIAGVKDANVNFASDKAAVEFDAGKANENDLEKAVEDVGYNVIITGGRTGMITLRVRGMSSQHCAGVVESSLRKLDGIKNIDVSFAI